MNKGIKMIHKLDKGEVLKFNDNEPAITNPEHRYIWFEAIQEDLNNRYKYLRAPEYPQVTDYLDAWVKDDKDALDIYKTKCLAVKSKYPKP